MRNHESGDNRTAIEVRHGATLAQSFQENNDMLSNDQFAELKALLSTPPQPAALSDAQLDELKALLDELKALLAPGAEQLSALYLAQYKAQAEAAAAATKTQEPADQQT